MTSYQIDWIKVLDDIEAVPNPREAYVQATVAGIVDRLSRTDLTDSERRALCEADVVADVHRMDGVVRPKRNSNRADRRAGSPLTRMVIYFGATLYAAMIAFALYATIADARCQNSGGKPMQFGFDIGCQR